MRGKWGSSSARFGVGQETLRRPLPGLGCRYPTAAPSHTPLPLLSPRALVEKTGRKRARQPGRLWGDGGGDDRRAGAGAGSAAGDGAGSPERRAGPCPLQEPFRSVTWDPSPELAAPAGASAVAERQACSGGPGARGGRHFGAPRPTRTSAASPGPPWPREMPVAGARGERPGAAGGGEREGEMPHSFVFTGVWSWGREAGKNAFLWGLRTFKAWQKGPEIKSLINGVFVADISHMGEDQQPWQKQEPIVTGPSFLATLPSFWKNKNNYKKLDSCCIFESLSENNAE